jgi:hypothetical protein
MDDLPLNLHHKIENKEGKHWCNVLLLCMKVSQA